MNRLRGRESRRGRRRGKEREKERGAKRGRGMRIEGEGKAKRGTEVKKGKGEEVQERR